jgi:hypothetical protein
MDDANMDGTEQPVPLPKPSLRKAKYILGCLAIALGMCIAYLRARAWTFGIMGAEGWGAMTGYAIIPALIAYAIAGRKSVRNFNRFGIWFSGLSLFFFIISSGHGVTLQQHIANLTKEASGTKAAGSGGPELDGVIRNMMREILDERKAFESQSSVYDAELHKLYSGETFSSADSMQKSMDAVRGIVAADQQYSRNLLTLPDRIQPIVDNSHLSDSDKQDFMEGVRKSFGGAKALQIRGQAMETEGQWQDATLSLYQYAKENAAKLHFDGKRVLIANRRVLNQFNERLENAQKLRNQLVDLNTKLETTQESALHDAGLTKSDLGLDGRSQANQK